MVKGGVFKVGSKLNEAGRIEIYDLSNTLIGTFDENGICKRCNQGDKSEFDSDKFNSLLNRVKQLEIKNANEEMTVGTIDSSSGKTKVTVSPCLAGLTFAEGAYPLPDGGVITVKAEYAGNELKIEYSAPEGIEVSVNL